MNGLDIFKNLDKNNELEVTIKSIKSLIDERLSDTRQVVERLERLSNSLLQTTKQRSSPSISNLRSYYSKIEGLIKELENLNTRDESINEDTGFHPMARDSSGRPFSYDKHIQELKLFMRITDKHQQGRDYHKFWWDVNDDLFRLGIEEVTKLYNEAKLRYREGSLGKRHWNNMQSQFDCAQGRLHDRKKLEKERVRLHTLNRCIDKEGPRLFADLLREFLDLDETPRENKLRFRNLLARVYCAEDRYGNIHCPITQRYLTPLKIIPTSIYPPKLGFTVMNMLFADHYSSTNLFSADNGILLPTCLSWAFLHHRIVFVPIPSLKGQRWQVKLVDFSITEWRMPEIDFKFLELDSCELLFLNSERPSKVLLYFHYLMAVFRALRNDGHIHPWGEDLPLELYIRPEMIRAFALVVGEAIFDKIHPGCSELPIWTGESPSAEEVILARELCDMYAIDEDLD